MTVFSDDTPAAGPQAQPDDDGSPLQSVAAQTAVDLQLRHLRGGARVLLIVQGASWARDYLALAKALAETGRHEIEVGIGFAGPTAHSFRQQCQEGGLRWFSLDREDATAGTAAVAEPATAKSRPAPHARIRAVAKRIPLVGYILLVGYHGLWLQKSRIKAVRLIAAHKPQVVVLSGYTGFEAAFLLKAAARRGTRVLRLDSFGAITPTWRAAARDRMMGRNLAVSGLGRWLLAAIFPQWTFRFADGRRIFYDAPEACIAALICGAMPKNPFAPAPGPITAFTAIHAYSRGVLEDSGVKPERIHLIGRLQDDATFHAVSKAMHGREACLKAVGLDTARPLILTSTAPFFEHKQMTAEDQLQHHELMFSVLGSIKGAQAAVSFHPAQKDRDEICAIAARHGIRAFATPGINELMPLATLYVDGELTVATIAAACGIPMIVVFLDMHLPLATVPSGERATRFQRYVASLRPPERFITGGMVFADGWKNVAALARRCINDRAYYEVMAEAQRQSAHLWAPAFDGKAVDRAVALVDQLAGGSLMNVGASNVG